MKSTVKVRCAQRLSDRCLGVYSVAPETARKYKTKTAIRCKYCYYETLAGRTNPNSRYAVVDSMFSAVDSPEKAYLLGWIASDGTLGEGSCTIELHPKDLQVVQRLRDIVCPELPLHTRENGGGGLVGFTISSKEIVKELSDLLQLPGPGKKDALVRFPAIPQEYDRDFIRGYFEGDGHIKKPKATTYPRADIASNSLAMLESIAAKVGLPCSVYPGRAEWSGVNALDFLHYVYTHEGDLFLERKRSRYYDWITWVPSLSGPSSGRVAGVFRWSRTRPDAVPPTKVRASDVGYDLTVIEAGATFGPVTLFDTGIKVEPDHGLYFDVVPRSSIIKSGYILANSIGVIDRAYTGTIKVPLMKLDPNATPLVLPARIAQIIPRPHIHVEFDEVSSIEDLTSRGSGGFGSTGL